MDSGAWAGVAFAVLVGAAALATYTVRLRRAHAVDRREIERLRDVAMRRADQVSVLSHEIRTPLAVIKGSSDLLAEETPGPLTDVQRRFVTTISESAATLTGLAEQLLTQARIEAGLFELHLRRVELRSFLRSVVRELRFVHDTDIVLDTPGPPTRVLLDPQLMSQLIGNLVGNGLRHSAATGETVRVRGQVADDMVVITISDLGRGMSEQQRDQLFGRFHSGAPIGEGTGIGLYISRAIAELHGGSIHVDTIAAHGTTMIVSFPAGAATEAARLGRTTEAIA